MEPVTHSPHGGVAVVIPTLNEAATIGRAIAAIPPELVQEVIVADSLSTDGTAEIARHAGARVVSVPRGYGRACAAGAASAGPGCDILVFMDGDGADPAEAMAQLVAPIRAGTHDFVLASRTRGAREKGAMSFHQLLAGYAAGGILWLRHGVRYTDMCAFRAIRRDALRRLGLREMGFGWNIEMQIAAARAGLRVLEVPLPYRRRGGGSSKVSGTLAGTLRAGWRIAWVMARNIAR